MENTEPKAQCHLFKIAQIAGDVWNLLIINQLLGGCKRFNELSTAIGNVTNSTLSDRLKKLVDEGIVERKQYEEIPPKVIYTLTSKGEAFRSIVEEMLKFEKEHLQDTNQ